MLKDKIKGLLFAKGLKMNDLLEVWQMGQPSLSNKIKNNTYNVHELVDICKLTGTKLCIMENDRVLFEINHDELKK